VRNITIIAVLLAAGCSEPVLAASLNWGVDLSDQDRSVRPGDNFAMYENGGWFKRTILSPQHANAAYWRDVRIDAGKRINQMLADLGARDPQQLTGVEAMVAAFHRSAMDNGAIDRAGLAPLQPELRTIRSARGRAEFARAPARPP